MTVHVRRLTRFARRYATCLSVLAIVLSSPAAKAADPQKPGRTVAGPGEISSTALVYVSDYLSFVGRDEQGYVAFALDTNRGRDGDVYQAEHFAVLHDERQGWVDLAGNGAYDNMEKALLGLPDSSLP